MDETDLKAIPELKQLQILDQSHPAVRLLLAESSSTVFAEVCNTARLFDLLHRDEYQVIAAIRFPEANTEHIRVYFQLLDGVE